MKTDIIKVAKPTSDPEYDKCNKRVVIRHDRDYLPDEDGWVVSLWSGDSRVFSSDSDAESPVIERDCGDGRLEFDVKDNTIAFDVEMHEQYGIRLLPKTGRRRVFDRVGWAYCTRKRYDSVYGAGAWDALGDRRDKEIRELAELRVRDRNLVGKGCVYEWAVERKRRFTKMYDDGEIAPGSEWVKVDGFGGYVTDCLDDIAFPRKPDLPVFYSSDVFLTSLEYRESAREDR